MKIYDEITGEEIVVPDKTKGYLYEGQRIAKHIDDTYEVMEGTVTEDYPEGLRRFIPGHDVYEDCQFYHTYTAEELAEMAKPTLQDQVDANAAAIAELAMMMAGGDE